MALSPTTAPTPVVSEPVISVPQPVNPGEQIGMSIRVDSVAGVSITYEWTPPVDRGAILDGQGTNAITYQAPTEPGTYSIRAKVVTANAVIERSVFVTVRDSELALPTATIVTSANTPSPGLSTTTESTTADKSNVCTPYTVTSNPTIVSTGSWVVTRTCSPARGACFYTAEQSSGGTYVTNEHNGPSDRQWVNVFCSESEAKLFANEDSKVMLQWWPSTLLPFPQPFYSVVSPVSGFYFVSLQDAGKPESGNLGLEAGTRTLAGINFQIGWLASTHSEGDRYSSETIGLDIPIQQDIPTPFKVHILLQASWAVGQSGNFGQIILVFADGRTISESLTVGIIVDPNVKTTKRPK